ncbi:MAG: hypothetical protein V1734_01135 [Nanoarchaeota archaeon]
MKKLPNISELKNKCRKFYAGNRKKVIDILLIGSFVKGKILPADIDIAVITIPGYAPEIGERLEAALDNMAHVTAYSIADMFHRREPIWLSMLHEGISAVTGKGIAESLFLEPLALFTYNTSLLKGKEEVKFFYALKGRMKQKGIIEATGSVYLAKTVILTPVSKDNEMQEFFNRWGVKFTRRRIFAEV